MFFSLSHNISLLGYVFKEVIVTKQQGGERSSR
jgi:hypothetical protein